MSDIYSIIIVAVLGIAGNIIYFEYRLRGERHKEVLKKRLTNLLLPLYFTLKDDELSAPAWNNREVGDEYEFDRPYRLFNKLADIIKNNLYLADNELHKGCLDFLSWFYNCDTKEERFQKLYKGNLEIDEELNKFSELIYKKYDEAREKYLK